MISPDSRTTVSPSTTRLMVSTRVVALARLAPSAARRKKKTRHALVHDDGV